MGSRFPDSIRPSIRIVAIFAGSAGWRRAGPSSSQLRVAGPVPTKRTATSRARLTPYTHGAIHSTHRRGIRYTV